MIHPEFWNRRRISFPGLEPAQLPATSRVALEEMGFAIVEERQPSFLLDGSVLITGEVDRATGGAWPDAQCPCRVLSRWLEREGLSPGLTITSLRSPRLRTSA